MRLCVKKKDMNWKKIILFVAIGGVLIYAGIEGYKYISNQKKLLEDYEVSLIGIRFSSLSQGLISGEATLRIKNKSAVEATIQEVFTEVRLNGEYLGNVKSTQPFAVPAKGSADVPLNFSFAGKELLKDLLKNVFTYITTKDIPYQLSGYVKMKSSFVSVSVPFAYNGSMKDDMLSSSVAKTY